MKTIIIYNDHDLKRLTYFLMEGDLSRFSDIYIGEHTKQEYMDSDAKKDMELENELYKILYDEDGAFRHDEISLERVMQTIQESIYIEKSNSDAVDILFGSTNPCLSFQVEIIECGWR